MTCLGSVPKIISVTTDSFGDKISSGEYVIGLDLMFEENGQVSIYANEAEYAKRGIVANGAYFTYADPVTYDAVEEPLAKVTYEMNRWYHINAVINTASGTAKYYVDGQLIGQVENAGFAASSFDQLIVSATFYNVSKKGIWVDNISVRSNLNLSAEAVTDMKLSDGSVQIDFTEPVDSLPISAVILKKGGTEVKVRRVVKVSSYQYKVYPVDGFEDGAEYSIEISDTVKNVLGKAYDGAVLYFTAEASDKKHQVLYDLIRDGYAAGQPNYVSDDDTILTEGRGCWMSGAYVNSLEFSEGVTKDTSEIVTVHYEFMHDYDTVDSGITWYPAVTLYVSDTGESLATAGHRYPGIRAKFDRSTGEGSLGYGKNLEAKDGWVTIEENSYLERGKWYSFDMVYNLKTGEVKYYIDGELFGTTSDGPATIRGIGWLPDHDSNSYGPSYWKNVKLITGDSVSKKYINVDLFELQKNNSAVSIEDVSAGDSVVLKLDANSTTSEKLQVIYAIYNGDVLSQAEYALVDPEFGTVELQIPQEVENGTELSIKAFIFDELLTPMADKIDI